MLDLETGTNRVRTLIWAGDETAGGAIALIEPGTEYLDARHTFDLRLSKMMQVGQTQLRLNADVYNAFNSNGVQSVNTTFSTNNTNWLNATGVQDPRQLYLSMQVNF